MSLVGATVPFFWHVFTHWFQFHQHQTQITDPNHFRTNTETDSVAVNGMHWYGLQ
jgi:hypothetical protein